MKRVLAFLVILCLSILAESVSALTKRSKKDECTVCHVLWMDAFLKDRETLLGPTQENIVINGSLGLSSSERMCYSCHDGYVVDSRTAIVQGNKHHQLKKVPDWLELPDTFRLDINNELYCGTCHGFHDVQASGDIGTVPFMRLENDRSEMCMACHRDKAEKLGESNHPLQKKNDIIPREKLKELGGKLGPEGEIICQSCHIPHGNPTLIEPLSESKICLVCHDDKKTVLKSDHNLAITFSEAKNTQGKGVEETGPCSSCHLPHKGGGKWMWARKQEEGNPASKACKSCHGQEQEARKTGINSHPLNVKPQNTPELPLFADDGSRVAEGMVQCPSCHDVHRWNPEKNDGYAEGMEGSSVDSFLRIGNDASELCVTCHDNKKALTRTDHDLRVTAPGLHNNQGMLPENSGPCGACHTPHNAANKRLWAGKPLSGNPASAMCLACHGEKSKHIQKSIGEHSHPIDVSPTPEIDAASDLPLYSEEGEKQNSGKVQCGSCHDPHRWDPYSLTSGSGENREGDGSNSFLRRANGKQSALCLTCHNNKKQVLSTDHNLVVTAPEERNVMGATPDQSGPCGACHAVHNASGERLWGKDLSGDEDTISQLCFSCHSSEGAASKKLVGGNSHPVNVALKKIDPDGKLANQLPLYLREGDEASSGKVVCTTCHDPHVWEPVLAAKGVEEKSVALVNREGGMKNSFLRKANYPSSALCTTCHVEQALVEGTPHDLNTSAPTEKNIQGQTVEDTGLCGACHLVHNSSKELKIWARKYGPRKRYDSKMVSLCTSCHFEGLVAENKVQMIFNHPEGIVTTSKKGFMKIVYDDSRQERLRGEELSKMRYSPILITNVIGATSGGNYTPIFDDKGQQVSSGKIACPSCHNVHKWNLNYQQGEEHKGAKFLRTESYNVVCVDCHVEDGIYRYLYFHSINRRLKIFGQ